MYQPSLICDEWVIHFAVLFLFCFVNIMFIIIIILLMHLIYIKLIIFYPSATSKIIISRNPTANPIVPRFECSPADASGNSSSTTT